MSLLALLGLFCTPRPTLAQAPAALDAPSDDDFISATERNEDPLGFDAETSSALERAAQEHERAQRRQKQRRQVRVRRGEVIRAVSSVRQSLHRVELSWSAGLMHARVELHWSLVGRQRAEVAHRLALPRGAVVASLQVCNTAGCVDATQGTPQGLSDYIQALATRAEAPAGLPAASAETIRDERGPALAVRAAPVHAGSDLQLVARYVAPAPIIGGRMRFTLPDRGRDPRASTSTVSLHAEGLTDVHPAEPVEVDPWQALEVSGRLASAVRTRTAVRCGRGQRCIRTFHARPANAPGTRPVQVWLDASRSMEGPARGRLSFVLAALLQNLDAPTQVWPLAFAARSESFAASSAGALPLEVAARSQQLELGASTQLGAAWKSSAQARTAGRARRVIILSDGRLSLDAENQRVLDRATRASIPVWLVVLDDIAVHDASRAAFARTGGGIAHVADAAALAQRTQDLTRLSEQLGRTLQPAGKPAAGEQWVTESRTRGRGPQGTAPERAWALRSEGPSSWVAVRHDPKGAVHGVDNYAQPLAGSEPFTSVLHPDEAAGAATGMPAESVLSMLRTQLVPAARGCLRTDRKGRANYAVALTFHLLLERREINEARIEGDIAAPLRACLQALLPQLTVPFFSGRIRLSYPIHTEREAPPPTVEMEPELRRTVDRTLRYLRRRR